MTTPYNTGENSEEVSSSAAPPPPAYPFGGGYSHTPPPIMSGPPGAVSGSPAPAPIGPGYFGQPTPGNGVVGGQQVPLVPTPGPTDDRARRWLPLLMIAAIVFLATTALMTVLYLVKAGDYDAQSGELIAAQSEANKRKEDLEKIARELGHTENELNDSEDIADQLAEEKNVIKQCIKGLGLANPRERNNPQPEPPNSEVLSICAEAFQILGIPLTGTGSN